jgi:type III restriction enzyme
VTPRPIYIEPVKERIVYDIAIPITKPQLAHNVKKITTLNPSQLEAIYDQEELEEAFRITLKMAFATTETEVHQADLTAGSIPISQELLGSITNKVIQRAKLANVFKDLYPLWTYGPTVLWRKVDIDDEKYAPTCWISGRGCHLARKIAELSVERRELEFES